MNPISLRQEATVVDKHWTTPMVSGCDRSTNKSGTGQRQCEAYDEKMEFCLNFQDVHDERISELYGKSCLSDCF